MHPQSSLAAALVRACTLMFLSGSAIALIVVMIAPAAAVGPKPRTAGAAPTRHHMVMAADPIAMSGSMMAEGSMAAGPSGHATATSVSSLTGPRSAARVRAFILTARPARLTLLAGTTVDAWTYNGTAPGPTLRVRQGDLVVVHLVNRLPVATTIHWHGVAVPNAEDGVAGLTQDAVAPGHSFTYRFVATEAGTYWYHAHQDGATQVSRGLYGALVVAPPMPAPPDQVDATVSLHVWQATGDVATANGTAGVLRVRARPGAWVRLRLINTDSALQLATPLGAPFQVVALDGRELHGPRFLRDVPLPIAGAQRYDLRFRQPARGAVTVRLAGLDGRGPSAEPCAIVVGPASARPAPLPAHARPWFDLATYGMPRPAGISFFTRADATYTLRLGTQVMPGGFSALQRDVRYTINGKIGPAIEPITVQQGQIIRLHIVNDTPAIHPMHLHGHTLVVLARNGRPLAGSPVMLDTLAVFPHESYDLAFRADNPGIWMLHCHNLYHARMGMTMMVMYRGVTTPYRVGGPAGNVAD